MVFLRSSAAPCESDPSVDLRYGRRLTPWRPGGGAASCYPPAPDAGRRGPGCRDDDFRRWPPAARSQAGRAGTRARDHRRRDRADAGACRAVAGRLVLLRPLRHRHRQHHHRADSGRRSRHGGRRCGGDTRPRARDTGGLGAVGAQRLRQHHRLADFCRLHVHRRLRADRPGTTRRAASGARAGAPNARTRVCRDAGRPRVRAVYAVGDGAQRGHDLSGHLSHPPALWVSS